MNKKLLLSLSVLFIIWGGYAVYRLNNNRVPDNSSISEVAISQSSSKIDNQVSTPKIDEIFTGILNMDKWNYNEKDKVYYQMGIHYAKTSSDSDLQKMALFVPEKYLRCKNINDNIYSCAPNMAAIIEGYTVRTAPIVTQIDNPNYSSVPALNEYHNYTDYTDAGLVYAHIGFRGIEHGAPAGVTDIKAAIRFIKNNSERIPGNTDSIFILAANHGAMLASIIGSSGNSRLYTPYLKEIGAINTSEDNIKGVMLINPKGSLDTANEALEWILNGNRKNLSPEQKKISDKLANEYAAYINRAGFIGPQKEALTLQHSSKGIYQNGTYYDYIKKVLSDAIRNFLQQTEFPYTIPSSWEINEETATAEKNIKLTGTFQNRKKFIDALNAKKTWIFYHESLGISIDISSLYDFNAIFIRKHLPITAYDGINKSNKENLLFAIDSTKGMHFDALTAKVFKNTSQNKVFTTDLYKQDKTGNTTLKRVDMYNPLYYLLSSYDGYKSSTIAPYWHIRTGVFQTTEPLTSSINLFLAVNNHPDVKTAELNAVWGMGNITKIQKKDIIEFIHWINPKYK